MILGLPAVVIWPNVPAFSARVGARKFARLIILKASPLSSRLRVFPNRKYSRQGHIDFYKARSANRTFTEVSECAIRRRRKCRRIQVTVDA